MSDALRRLVEKSKSKKTTFDVIDSVSGSEEKVKSGFSSMLENIKVDYDNNARKSSIKHTIDDDIIERTVEKYFPSKKFTIGGTTDIYELFIETLPYALKDLGLYCVSEPAQGCFDDSYRQFHSCLNCTDKRLPNGRVGMPAVGFKAPNLITEVETFDVMTRKIDELYGKENDDAIAIYSHKGGNTSRADNEYNLFFAYKKGSYNRSYITKMVKVIKEVQGLSEK